MLSMLFLTRGPRCGSLARFSGGRFQQQRLGGVVLSRSVGSSAPESQDADTKPPLLDRVVIKLNDSIKKHPGETLAVLFASDIGSIGAMYSVLSVSGIEFSPEFALAFAASRPFRRFRLPLDLAVAAGVSKVFPAFSKVRLSDLAGALPNRPGPTKMPDSGMIAKAMNKAKDVIDNYGAAYMMGSRLAGVSVVCTLYALIKQGVDLMPILASLGIDSVVGLFALLLAACHGMNQDSPGNTKNFFNLSLQTLSTTGYGALHPANACANWISVMESFSSMLLTSFITGIAFVKFARPHPSIVFSEVFTVSQGEDGLEVRFRVANETRRDLASKGDIIDVSFKLILMRVETGKHGEPKLCYYDLKLETTRLISLRLEIELVHVINASSPLFEQTSDDVVRSDLVFILIASGLDENLHDMIHAKREYGHQETRWGAKFQPMLNWDTKHKFIELDLDKISAVVSAPIKSKEDHSIDVKLLKSPMQKEEEEETVSTVGYGALSPRQDSNAANFFVFLLVFSGLLVSTLLTGITWAKFSIPKASTLLYSDVLLLTTFHSQRAIMFRAANNRKYGVLVEGSFRMSIVVLNRNFGRRETHELRLARNVWPIISLCNTVTHVIDERSPLYNLSTSDLLSGDHFFVVLFTGLDNIISDTMVARKAYHACDILVDHHFEDNITLAADGLYIDLDAINATYCESDIGGQSSEEEEQANADNTPHSDYVRLSGSNGHFNMLRST
ncbi:hypothetical protein PRNP1_009521 [Phytophthora ramorum]